MKNSIMDCKTPEELDAFLAAEKENERYEHLKRLALRGTGAQKAMARRVLHDEYGEGDNLAEYDAGAERGESIN